nr:MAG TPA: hypothetical protein [Caudoviricetes sp.]
MVSEMSYIAHIPMWLRLYSNSQWKQIRKVARKVTG